jgi:hypothetical protein
MTTDSGESKSNAGSIVVLVLITLCCCSCCTFWVCNQGLCCCNICRKGKKKETLEAIKPVKAGDAGVGPGHGILAQGSVVVDNEKVGVRQVEPVVKKEEKPTASVAASAAAAKRSVAQQAKPNLEKSVTKV